VQETSDLIARIRSAAASPTERHQAFGLLVRRFQDMAYGCALAHLGDSHLAEDAAQDAFLAAWQCLPQLRDPAAFPGWLRRLVLTQCRRRTRGKHLATVSLDSAAHLPAPDDPQAATIANEQRAAVRDALQTLPEGQRLAVVLFYIGDHSRAEVAAFLGISELAVKKRLAAARKRLHERMLHLMEDNLHEQRPSRDPAFAERIAAFTQGFSELIDQGTSLVRSLEALAARQSDPAFRAAIDEINRDIQEGGMLSRSMAKHPQFFDEHYTRAVRLGEVTGTLEVQLQRLALGEEIFDEAGRLRLRGVDDPLVTDSANALLRSALRHGDSRFELVAEGGGCRSFWWADGQQRAGKDLFPEILPLVMEHYKIMAGIAGKPPPQEGHFPFTAYNGKTYDAYDVQVQVQESEGREEMTLTLTPQ